MTEDDLIDVVAQALINSERAFAHSVAAGEVTAGQYLTDSDRARNILATLQENGYQVIPKPATSFGYRIEHETGEHVELVVFAGPHEGARGHCGHLTLRADEARDLQALLSP